MSGRLANRLAKLEARCTARQVGTSWGEQLRAHCAAIGRDMNIFLGLDPEAPWEVSCPAYQAYLLSRPAYAPPADDYE